MVGSRISRRSFIRRSAGVAGAAMAARTILLDSPSPAAAAVPPSDTVRFGIIGIGMQGTGLLESAVTIPGVECVAACDLYDGRHDRAREIVGKNIPTTRRYQELLDNKEIDCLIAAVPDHWHKQVVVDACSAGKDIYCEKPMTHFPAEGLEMIEAQKKYNRVVQIGSQRVSSAIFAKAKELIAQGAIGDVCLVECTMGRNDPNGAWVYPPPPDLSPQTLDWNTWLGDAPRIPFNPLHFARWRCWQAYGSGVAGDLIVHMMSGINFAMGTNQPPDRTLAVGGLFRWKDGRDEPDVHVVLYDYPNYRVMVRLTLNTDAAEVTRFMGTRGMIEMHGSDFTLQTQDGQDHSPGWYYPSFPKPLREQYERDWHAKNDARVSRFVPENTTYKSELDYDDVKPHQRNFFNAVRTRQPVTEDTTFGHHAALACHLGNYSYFNKCIALWDGKQIVKG